MNIQNLIRSLLVFLFVSCVSISEKDIPLTDDTPTSVLDLPNSRIAYYQKGKGPHMILLHAAGHDHHDFDSISNELSKSYTVTSIDWPGHGKSEWKENAKISSIGYPEILKEICGRLKIQNPIILGNSVGGYAAMKLSIENPDLTKALILVDTGGMNELDIFSTSFIKLKSKEWFTSLVWNQFPRFYIKQENEYTHHILKRIERSKDKEGSIQNNSAIWASFLEKDYNLREDVAKIQVPVLIIWGKDDPVIERKFGQELHGRVKQSEYVELPVGHIPFAESPDEFNQILSSFLKKNLASSKKT
ncbi:Ndr family protein [Leptospira ryugenii]|uniref:Ndr family protein n=1 Tax=Leptospira ryugenii TaxID=1917863 RepID=A0A2P2E1Z4_9LEPT|nr:alpha/beta hydrolase [Leptospira ryugenii]GBF50922.1 Ndr family protein [Leptospira ryugenii]